MYKTYAHASSGCMAPRLTVLHSIKVGDGTSKVENFHDRLLVRMTRMTSYMLSKRLWPHGPRLARGHCRYNTITITSQHADRDTLGSRNDNTCFTAISSATMRATSVFVFVGGRACIQLLSSLTDRARALQYWRTLVLPIFENTVHVPFKSGVPAPTLP